MWIRAGFQQDERNGITVKFAKVISVLQDLQVI